MLPEKPHGYPVIVSMLSGLLIAIPEWSAKLPGTIVSSIASRPRELKKSEGSPGCNAEEFGRTYSIQNNHVFVNSKS